MFFSSLPHKKLSPFMYLPHNNFRLYAKQSQECECHYQALCMQMMATAATMFRAAYFVTYSKAECTSLFNSVCIFLCPICRSPSQNIWVSTLFLASSKKGLKRKHDLKGKITQAMLGHNKCNTIENIKIPFKFDCGNWTTGYL